jgi:hypothetical protein
MQAMMQGPLDFVWEHNNPVKSDITDGTGRVLYTASTPWAISHQTTTITRADGQVVAVAEWHNYHKDTVLLRGQQMVVREWLPHTSGFKRCVRAGGCVRSQG